MANFTFTIASEFEEEMSSLMVRLFNHSNPTPVREVYANTTEQVMNSAAKAKPAKAKPVAVVEPEPVVEDAAEEQPEITLQAIKHLGSQAMSHPAIKASGVAAVLSEFGGGADSFASLKEEYYPAVHKELSDRL